jgi:uncharacterized protein YPO0396
VNALPQSALSLSTLSLSKLFLHNWHRFDHHVIPVEGGLYLAGENGSGKTSILDALQLVLVADLQKVRFNISAQDRSSSRNLDGYVRGKIGESDYLRPASAVVGYVVLEFKSSNSVFTAGVCIEAFREQGASRTFFILDKELDPENFAPGRIPRTRRELKKYLSNHGGKSFEVVGEYQDQLLNRLGGLNRRFFDLFMQALAFKPIRNVREFVEQWILPEQILDLAELQQTKEQLERLQTLYKETTLQVEELSALVKRQVTWQRQLELHLSYTLLTASLKVEIARRDEQDLTSGASQLEAHLARTTSDLSDANHLYQVTQQAYVDAMTRLSQSDVVRRQKELEQRQNYLITQLRTVLGRRDRLLTLWQQQRQGLQRLLATKVLSDEETGELSALLTEAFSDNLQDGIANLIVLLGAALERTQQDLGVTRQNLNELRRSSTELQRSIEAVGGGQKQYRPNVERLMTFLERELYLPELLCEVAEVTDESWQNAIEAMLGRRRFHLLVKPEDYRQAVRLLDVARREQNIYGVSVLDAEKVLEQRRPSRVNSLATSIDSENVYVRAYLDSVLGNIIACDSVDELRNFERSVTREVVVYSEWSVSAADPEKYKTWYVGSRAKASQLAALREKLERVREEIFVLSRRDESLETASKLLSREGPLTELKLGLAEGLETAVLEAELSEVERELSALDLSGVQALQQEVERLRAEQDRYFKRTQDLVASQKGVERDVEASYSRLLQAREVTQQRDLELRDLNERYPDVAATIEKERLERLAQEDWLNELRKVEAKMQEFQTKAQNEQNAFIEEATRFNTQHQFAANARDVNEGRYQAELERLQGSELPKYQSDIETRQKSAEQELREHVLSKLFEQFEEAQRLLKQINEALQGVDFRGERYRFRAEARDGELGEFYRLIKEWQPTLLLRNVTDNSEQTALFERFYQTFSRLPKDDRDRQEQEKLKDYRHYLDYEIMVSYPDGREERFSRIMSQTSGGETQTPFYLTIAASFVQEYKLRLPGRPTLRLVVFDEAFSKMDQDRIGAALELFQTFGLQLVIATPLDRSVYIVPKMQTSLVLSKYGRHGVHIDSYWNYLGGEEGLG